ncbi:MAG: tetratricopeptide repeat protein [Methanobacteriaceae archaeon]|nr:tetratricopeptide repeat protein [Methanobacteriaceae archaeon]
MFDNIKINNFLKKGNRYFYTKNYDLALDYFESILLLDDNHKEALFKKACIYVEFDRYSEAISILDLLEETTDVLLLKGRIHILQNEYDTGLKYYKKASKVYDFDKFNQELIYYAHTSSLDDELNRKIFLELCDIILEKDDIDEIRLLKSSTLYLYYKNYDGALNNINYILAHNPKNVDALELKSSILRSYEKYDEAVDTATKALNLGASDVLLYYTKIYGLYKLNKLDEAEEFCKEYISLNPLDSEGFLLLSKIFYKKEKYDLALDNVNSALIRSSKEDDLEDYCDVSWFKALILFTSKDYEQSMNICNLLIKDNPKKSRNYYLKAKILFDEGKLDESLKYINKALELDSDCPEAIELKNKIENY